MSIQDNKTKQLADPFTNDNAGGSPIKPVGEVCTACEG